MIGISEYVMTCDHPGKCDARVVSDSRSDLMYAAGCRGWQLYVKRDGTLAATGGKDYCPRHHRPFRP
jgi:hypothetical protein